MAGNILSKLTDEQRAYFAELKALGLVLTPTSTGQTIRIGRNDRQLAYFDSTVKSQGGLIGYRFLFPEDKTKDNKITGDNNGWPLEKIEYGERPLQEFEREEKKLLKWACSKFSCNASDVRVRRSRNESNKDRLFLNIMSVSIALRALGIKDVGTEDGSTSNVGQLSEDTRPNELPERDFLEALEESFAKDVQSSQESDPSERRRRLREAPKIPKRVEAITYAYIRNPDVVAEVLARAKGSCESCGREAPFKRRSDASPYLEVHHRVPLASGGEDTVGNAEALCPNCHRQKHYG